MLTWRESAIFERVPLLHIWTRYSSAATSTTKILMQNSSYMYAISKLIEQYSLVATFTKEGEKESGVARLFSNIIYFHAVLPEPALLTQCIDLKKLQATSGKHRRAEMTSLFLYLYSEAIIF